MVQEQNKRPFKIECIIIIHLWFNNIIFFCFYIIIALDRNAKNQKT